VAYAMISHFKRKMLLREFQFQDIARLIEDLKIEVFTDDKVASAFRNPLSLRHEGTRKTESHDEGQPFK